MPSLTTRPNGVPVRPTVGTGHNITIKRTSKYFHGLQELRSDDNKVLNGVLTLIVTDTNQMMLGGDSLAELIRITGLSESTVRNSIVRLVESSYLLTTSLPTELIVNPAFASKGSEVSIWKFIQSIEYFGDVPREVTIYSVED